MENLTHCTPSSSVEFSAHEEGMVLMDLGRGRLFASNRAGALIWQALQQQKTPETIAAGLSRDYRIPFEAARACTARFIAQLAAYNLIQIGADE